jgi:hypothetical protein
MRYAGLPGICAPRAFGTTAPFGVIPGMRLVAGACYVAAMSKPPDRMIAGFTTGERDYIRREIRRELDIFFSTLPSVAEGF